MTTDVELVPTPVGQLPDWASVLAVVAHPDDESFGLGAILDAFAKAGSTVSVLCLTQGDASTIGASGDLATVRAAELQSAAQTLGVASTVLRDYPDGALAGIPSEMLQAEVAQAVEQAKASGLVVFDLSGVSRHPDHTAASAAALAAAETLNLPVLAWTLPGAVVQQLKEEFNADFAGHDPSEIDLVVAVSRDQQRTASLAHVSQAIPTSMLWRRLELQGDSEHLRWLRRSDTATSAPQDAPADASEPDDMEHMRVDYRTGDRFDIAIRNHVISVDQPEAVGGEDLAPTPTELFVASLASCVAFYARRYLRRNKLDATGLTVQTSYRMGAKPARVADIDISIHLPQQLPEAQRKRLLAVAGHCTVHNSITSEPRIDITLAENPDPDTATQ